MNCGEFQQVLFEHVDGSLLPGAQRECEKHLEGCLACREMLLRHQQIAQGIRNEFARLTEELALAPRVRRNVMAARRGPSWRERLAGLWGWRPLRWACAALVLCVVVLVGTRAQKQVEAPTRASEPRALVHVRSSRPVTSYTFLKENGRVIDTLVYRTNVLQESWAQQLPVRRSSATRLPL
jgi:anti-sigma factor RsiW